MNSIIEVKDASFSYGEKEVLKKVSFSVKAGEIFCIVGPNGCGKTTLLDCVLGISRLKEGQIFLDNEPVFDMSHKMRAEKIAYIPQAHERTFPYSVEEIVLMGRAHKTRIFSYPGDRDRDVAMEAMNRIGISSLAHKPYTQISGGEAQLVMIARALAQQSKIIIMDEPTAHLDFKNELLLLETITDLIKNRSITIIMATHFLNHALYFQNNGVPAALALMNNGNFQAVGSPRQVLNEENIKMIYGVNSKVINWDVNDETSIMQIVPLSIEKETDKC